MKPSERLVTFPTMGRKNSEVLKSFLESLELKVIMPPPTTDETIKRGSKYSANMMCIPFKVTLGNYIEALDLGANTLIAYDTEGTCRFRQYNKLHEFVLSGLGYDFKMFVMNPNNIVSKLKQISGKSTIEVLKKIYQGYQSLKINDEQSKVWSEDIPNIGIIGEIFCTSDEKINYRLEEKIKKFGGNPFNTATTTDFMRGQIPLFTLFGLTTLFKKDELKRHKEEAKEYGDSTLGGHAYENLYNLLHLVEKKVDGVVHVMPLACMPEGTIETYLNHICRENKIPLLRIHIDENSAEANLETRLETFCELLKIRKK